MLAPVKIKREMSIIRIIATGFLVCILALTSCSRLIHSLTTKTAETVIAKTVSELARVQSYQLDTDFIDEFGLTEWKGTKVVNVSDKDMGMNMVITMGSFPFISVSDEMYFMNGQEYWDTISEANIPQTVVSQVN